MKLFNRKSYKTLYKEKSEEYVKLLKDYDDSNKKYIKAEKSYKGRISDLEMTLKALENFSDEQGISLKKQIKECEKLSCEIVKKEKQRRKCAGAIGGLTAKNHSLLKEKKEMLELINRLLAELRKASREKKKPTIEELRNYFRINY